MKLEDLFVSFKLVEPVQFKRSDSALPTSIYLNLDRAKLAAMPSEDPDDKEEDISHWSADKDYDWLTRETISGTQLTTPTPTAVTKNNLVSEQEDFSRLTNYLIKKEGFVGHVYNDTGGNRTIGYGFTDPTLLALGKMTEAEGRKHLQNEIIKRRDKLKSQISTWDQLSKNQQDSLISYGYNVGVENWAKTQPQLLKALNEGRFDEAAQYMDVTKTGEKYLRGLTIRRKEEQNWFNEK